MKQMIIVAAASIIGFGLFALQFAGAGIAMGHSDVLLGILFSAMCGGAAIFVEWYFN